MIADRIWDRPQNLVRFEIVQIDPRDNTGCHLRVDLTARGFAPDRTTIDVEHETIPGFMPSMTMPFTARDSGEIAHLHRGDAISFQLAVTDKDAWIANVRRIALEEVRLPKASPTSSPKMAESKRLREGDAMPAFGLTSEAGEKITRETFLGRPLVITFIFTRCPMPNFCRRMSKISQNCKQQSKAAAARWLRRDSSASASIRSSTGPPS